MPCGTAVAASVKKGASSSNPHMRGPEGSTEEEASQPQRRGRDLQAWDETQEALNQSKIREKGKVTNFEISLSRGQGLSSPVMCYLLLWKCSLFIESRVKVACVCVSPEGLYSQGWKDK